MYFNDNISLNSSQDGNILDKSCRENKNTYFIFSIFSENRVVYEITGEDTVEPDRPQLTTCYNTAQEGCDLHIG